MKITKPTNKVNKQQKRISKKGILLKKYPRGFFEQCPPQPVIVEALKDDLQDWAFNLKGNDLTMLDYLYDRNINYSVWLKLLKKHPDLKTEWENARIFLGNKREKGALNRDLSEKLVMRTMPMYSKEFKELEEWYAKIRSLKEEVKDMVFTLKDLVKRKDNINEKEDKKGE